MKRAAASGKSDCALVFSGGFLFFDEIGNQARHAAATKTAGGLVLRFTFGIAHKPSVKRFFRPDIVVVIKSQFAALAAL